MLFRICLEFLTNDELFFVYNCRELYPRVLECILQTESSEIILAHKDEILETLEIVANDKGK